jgi:hypothetical protein
MSPAPTAGLADAPEAKSPVALLLRGGSASADDERLVTILDFFGIPWVALTSAQATDGDVSSVVAGLSRFSILTSPSTLAEILPAGNASTLPEWMSTAAAIFVYGFQPTDTCRHLLRVITTDPEADIRSLGAQSMLASISWDAPEVCGPMSGLQVLLQSGAAHAALTVKPTSRDFKSIIAVPDGQLFARTTLGKVPFFLDASESIVDIHQPAAIYFDVKKCFAGAVPLVMFLMYAFREICVAPAQTNACVIIDDPLLQQRYGFLNFRELLQLMEKLNFATSIAFIPWNWRRSHRSTVSDFQANQQKLSICIHGCDHSGAEFATRAPGLLNALLKTANSRMEGLREKTGLAHDRVMVFPQGSFSPEAVTALKSNGFLAAVNTEIAPADNAANETTIADLWSVAILRYGQFPIYTRRYMQHGIENFAFDGLLGKPCFVVGHHELLRDYGKNLSYFIARLSSLHWNLSWRTVGDAVIRSYRMQRRDGVIRLKMFSEQTIFENRETIPLQITVLKDEACIKMIKSVTFNGENLNYSFSDGCLQFVIQVAPESVADIRCNYHEVVAPPVAGAKPVVGRAKVAARRYLSEFRDNYLARNELVLKASSAAKRLLK